MLGELSRGNSDAFHCSLPLLLPPPLLTFLPRSYGPFVLAVCEGGRRSPICLAKGMEWSFGVIRPVFNNWKTGQGKIDFSALLLSVQYECHR